MVLTVKLYGNRQLLGNPKIGYNIPTVPIVWKYYVIVGSAAGGDIGNGVGTVQGNITALNINDGSIIMEFAYNRRRVG